jgi:uncharacterized damage-inducible protein DinB
MSKPRHMVAAIESEYKRYKALGEGTFAQLEDRDLVEKPTPESLSIAMIVWHVSGNLESRFTDFLTTDGEKPWRDRESEFADRRVSRKELLAKWERGWGILFAALASLRDRELTKSVTIRGIAMTVGEALERSVAHTSYHVGQITFLGKMLRRSGWKYLSIPPGQTAAYNANPTREKGAMEKGGSRASASAGTAKSKSAKRTAKPATKKPAPTKAKPRGKPKKARRSR